MARFFLLATLLVVLFGLSSATICETYSGTTTNATMQQGLITGIVARAVTGGIYTSPSNQTVQINGLFNSSGPLYNIFTGTTKYRSDAPNYVTDTTAQGTLAGKLVAYFGALFGCNAAGYPAVSQYNQYAVHQNMNITNAMETYFNTALANTLVSLGVSSNDVSTAGTVLGYFNRCGAPISGLGNGSSALTQICGQSDCPIAGNSNTGVCTQYYGYPNGASAKYAFGGLFVALAAIVATLLL